LIFTETGLKGAYLIEPQTLDDERGCFARLWDKEVFEKHDLDSKLVQCNISFNIKKGTLRGMHFQAAPYEEKRLVRCTRGKIFDVIIDLRPESYSYKKWEGVELSDENYKMLYIPDGFAHGFQTLEDNTEVFYQISEFYRPEYSRGVRWDDKAFQIKWPLKPSVISEKDQKFKLLE